MKNFFPVVFLVAALSAAVAQPDAPPVPALRNPGSVASTNTLGTALDHPFLAVPTNSQAGTVAPGQSPRLELAPAAATNQPSLGLGHDSGSTNAASLVSGAVASSANPLEALATQIAPLDEAVLLPAPQKPNEISFGRVVMEGITVQAIKTKQPLQLINPFASTAYGSPEDNVLRDPVSGNISGWKIFSLRF